MARKPTKQVIRPLPVLVSLIKQDLKDGDEAAESAGMPFYIAAGEKLWEAKPQVKGRFTEWVQKTFDRSPRQCNRYMAAAHATVNKRFGRARPFESISDAERHVGRHVNPSSGAVRREWRQDVDDIAERARRDMERIQEEDLTRKQEREAETKLALRLIDIGYKVLAKELHPDSGGSWDAMQRLVHVRDRLKASA